ncbi:MAG: hypothetical protein E5X77_03740 [Mesorhizobium sp.]|nr:MAG: hypothetical protein E5X77_03740 [Mesorhizobium sp.]
MNTKMTHAMRMELANAVRDRYAAATTKDKRRILEEFIAAKGYHEKSAIRVLNSHPEPKHRQTRQRPSLYDEAARGALIVLWEGSDRVCGKRLKALLPRCKAQHAYEKEAKGCARAPAAHQNAHLCRLERAASRQHGNGPGRSLRRGQPR